MSFTSPITSNIHNYRGADPSRYNIPIDLSDLGISDATCSAVPSISISMYDGTSDARPQSTLVAGPTFQEPSIVIKTHIPMSSVGGQESKITRAEQLRLKIQQSQKQWLEVNEDIADLIEKHIMQSRSLCQEVSLDSKEITSEIALIEQSKQLVKNFTESLTKYNDLKDAAMILLDVIAEKEQRTLKHVMEERGIIDE